MTIQLRTTELGKSKQALASYLNDTHLRGTVRFYDPGFLSERHFTGADLKPGEKFACVLNHPFRTRFAMVEVGQDGKVKVL